MGIERIEVYSVSLQYYEPFTIALGTSTTSNNVVVKVVTDFKIVGWGEASPSFRITNETQENVLAAFEKICPKLIGTCPFRVEQTIELMDKLVDGNTSAKAAIDMALHDIIGKKCKKPLYMLMGGYRTEVLTDITIGIKPPKEMAKAALKAVKKGFKALKLKVGVNPKEDVQRIKSVREAVGAEVKIRIDANQGWKPKEAIEVINKIEGLDIEFVEQPVKADDIKGLAYVKKESPIPIMADESVHSPADAIKIIQAEAADLINVKLMKSGGISKAKKIVAIAEAAKIPCMVGCMGESRLGISAAAHLAAALKNIEYADLDSDLMLRTKLVKRGGVGLKNSKRIIPEKIGLGISTFCQEVLGSPIRIYK